MNIMFNNSTNMLININNINNNKEAKKSDKKENKNIKDKNKDNNKSPLDLIKNSYSESIEDKNKMFEEIKNIMNKYKKNFSYEDSTRIDYLFDKLQKKL